mgnify:CR=1 FL=1
MPQKYKTWIIGAEEVPPVCTKSRGYLKLKYHKKKLNYKLCVKHIKKVTAAHLHLGRPGENGPILVTLFDGKAYKPEGLLACGEIKSKDLRGPLLCGCLKELIALIDQGLVYVNVHTEKYPNGKIRGQLHNECERYYAKRRNDYLDFDIDVRGENDYFDFDANIRGQVDYNRQRDYYNFDEQVDYYNLDQQWNW